MRNQLRINQKISTSLKGRPNPHRGVPHTEESKNKISNSLRLKSSHLPFEKLSRPRRKEIVLKEQNNLCSICENPFTWMGLPLTPMIDHIDGNRKNNIRKNLRAICPNCHSQTPTFCSKNVSKEGLEKISKTAKNTAKTNLRSQGRWASFT